MKTGTYNRLTTILKHAARALPILLIAMFVGQQAALGQSTDRDNPTPLSSADMSGEFHQDDPEYFYGFNAQPGDLTLTLDLQARNYGGALTITIFDLKGHDLGGLDKVVMKGQTARVVRTIKFAKQQPVVMRIFSGNGEGYYKLRIDGVAAYAQGSAASQQGAPQGQQNPVQPGAASARAGAVGVNGNQSGDPSTDRDNPTPLPADGVQGEFHQDDPEYFYSFSVQPGTKLTFTLDLKAKNYGGALYVTLFDQNGRELGGLDKVVLKGQTARVTKDIRFEKQQIVIMRIFSGNGEGFYKLSIGNAASAAGMAEVNGATSATEGEAL
ncbi:MAG TPA: hypothetical protein VLZ81_07830 [Blastocatellia bacterium]|nr:hypothetical protein [Blastocatellia bacterium]